MHSNNPILASFIGIVLLLGSCRPGELDHLPDDVATMEPLIVPLDLDSGYVINPSSGDSTNYIFDFEGSGEWKKWDYIYPPEDSLLPPTVAKISPDSIVILEPEEYQLSDPKSAGSTFHELTEIEPYHECFTSSPVKVQHPEPIASGKVLRADKRTRDIKFMNAETGLPSARVWTAEDDANGDIWMGTWEEGAVRWDGNQVFIYTEKHGLPGRDVRELFVDRDNNLWMGSAQGGLTRYDGEYFHNYTFRDYDQESYYVQKIYQDSKGDMWTYGFGMGVSKLVGDTLYRYRFIPLDQANDVQTSYLDSKDRMWVIAGGNKIYHILDDGVYQIADLSNQPFRAISGISETSDGTFWFCTRDGYLIKLIGDQFTYYRLRGNKGLTDPYVSGSEIWYGAQSAGVMKFNWKTETVSFLDKDDGLSQNAVVTIRETADGTLLFGTLAGGAVFYNPNSWKNELGEDFPILGNNLGFVRSPDGAEWYASSKGLAKIKGDSLSFYKAKNNPPMGSVAKMLYDLRGNLWFISRGVLKMNGSEMSTYLEENGIRHIWCRPALAHSDSSMWIGTYSEGITVIDEDEIRFIDRRNGLISPLVLAFLQDSKGRVWAGTYLGGVTLFDGDSVITYTEKEGLPWNDIRAIAEDRLGNIWAGTSGAGVFRFDGKEFVIYNKENGLSGNLIEDIQVDKNGNVWVGSRTGLSYFEYDSEKEENHLPRMRNFDLSNGLVNKVSVYQGSLVDTNNVLYWGFDQCRSSLNVDNTELFPDPPLVTITNVIIDGNYICFNSDSTISDQIRFEQSMPFYNVPEKLELEYDKGKLRFDFKADNVLASDDVYYSYYIEGLDNDWSQPSLLAFADYRYIGYGDFTLHVRAQGSSKEWGAETLYTFTILPPWYHTAWARTLYVIGCLGIIFLIFKWRTRQLLARQKELEYQVDQATLEIRMQHEEIMDSIAYAKRIQSAILPPQKLVKEFLQDSFILYKPKDVVAGDFYWMAHTEGKVLFAAADCTGHGVPGAMVSVICNGGLNRSVNEFGLSDPGKILDKTREIVIKEFEKSEEEVKDGMDIALCSLTSEGLQSLDNNGTALLQYAGAHNALWIIRKGVQEVEEIKADKQPIGKYAEQKPFTTHSVELKKGDAIYIFSDGYADQFGGDKGKKFKSANFKRLLLSIQNESMERQRQLLDDAFEKWRGNLEQVDDICVIGVRI